MVIEGLASKAPLQAEPAEFLTISQFKELEKANLPAALKHANWKTWGPDGAAELLGVKPSTLTYQMKLFGIVKDSMKN